MKKWTWIVMDGETPQRWSQYSTELQAGGYAQGFATKAEAEKAKFSLRVRYFDIANRATSIADPVFKEWNARGEAVTVIRVRIA